MADILFQGETVQALGRNGWFEAAGLTFAIVNAGLGVQVENLRRNGATAKGSIAIPANPAILKAVAEEFNQLAKQLEESANAQA